MSKKAIRRHHVVNLLFCHGGTLLQEQPRIHSDCVRLINGANRHLDMYHSVDQRSTAEPHIYLLFDLAYVLGEFKFALAQEYLLPAGLRVEPDCRALLLIYGRLGPLAAEKDGELVENDRDV